MSTSAAELTVGRPRRGRIGTVFETIGVAVGQRRLIWYLAVSSLRKRGTDSLLGNLWWVLDPALQMGVYYVLVGIILKRSEPAYPLFLFAAILPWKWFSTCLADSTSSIRLREKVLRQIAFPQIVLPIATMTASLASFTFGLIPLLALYLFYPDRLTAWILLLPVVAAVQLLWTLPFAVLLSASNVFFRDVGNLVGHLLRLWFYLSPGLFSVERIREIADRHPPLSLLVDANPFTWLFGAYRDLLYYGRAPDWVVLGALALASLPVSFVAIHIFRRVSPSFVKVL